jgi:hypothetical protein
MILGAEIGLIGGPVGSAIGGVIGGVTLGIAGLFAGKFLGEAAIKGVFFIGDIIADNKNIVLVIVGGVATVAAIVAVSEALSSNNARRSN